MGEITVHQNSDLVLGDVRYSAPELIENNNIYAAKCLDTYSFAMLILECITEEVPFPHLSHDAAVIHVRINRRQHPPRPDGRDPRNSVSNDLWDLMMRCWSFNANQRPKMAHVHSFFLNSLGRGGAEGIDQREGTGEEAPNAPTSAGGNVGTFFVSDNADDEAGWPGFSLINHGHAAPLTMGQSKPVKHRL